MIIKLSRIEDWFKASRVKILAGLYMTVYYPERKTKQNKKGI